MGLGFYIGQGGIENLGEYLGQMEMDEHHWLQKNGFLIAGETGHFPDKIESLPYFDDAVLTHAQVKRIKEKFDLRKKESLNIAGFKSEAVEKFEMILSRAFKEEQGLSTCAD